MRHNDYRNRNPFPDPLTDFGYINSGDRKSSGTKVNDNSKINYKDVANLLREMSGNDYYNLGFPSYPQTDAPTIEPEEVVSDNNLEIEMPESVETESIYSKNVDFDPYY